jgi:hypothetical protein
MGGFHSSAQGAGVSTSDWVLGIVQELTGLCSLFLPKACQGCMVVVPGDTHGVSAVDENDLRSHLIRRRLVKQMQANSWQPFSSFIFRPLPGSGHPQGDLHPIPSLLCSTSRND